MRDPNRIEPLLAKVAQAWKKYPDLRFGQFMSNFFGFCGRDPFYAEDDVWEAALDAFINGADPAAAMKAYEDKQLDNLRRSRSDTPFAVGREKDGWG